jgi:hypothetical protein
MRADGATVNAVRAYLAEHGIHRSYHGTAAMLSSKLLLGEIHFGDPVALTPSRRSWTGTYGVAPSARAHSPGAAPSPTGCLPA